MRNPIPPWVTACPPKLVSLAKEVRCPVDLRSGLLFDVDVGFVIQQPVGDIGGRPTRVAPLFCAWAQRSRRISSGVSLEKTSSIRPTKRSPNWAGRAKLRAYAAIRMFHALRRGLRHLQMEFRQDEIRDARGQREWAVRLAQALT